tara:strand:+ start:1523 stop:1798 length:276 start_codon:yes stop_codon:yes gene_type:complete
MDYTYSKENNRFTIKIDEMLVGEINYTFQDDILDLLRVYVSPSHRGKSIASKITTWVLKYAKNNHLKIIPTCSYVSHTFLKMNPHFNDLVL